MENVRDSMRDSRKRYMPGPGWRYLGGAVYENSAGARVHLFGLCKLAGGKFVRSDDRENRAMFINLVRINGGNVKRGLMAWANKLCEVSGREFFDDYIDGK